MAIDIISLKINPLKVKVMLYNNLGVEFNEDELYDSINHIRVLSEEEYFIKHQAVNVWFNRDYQVTNICHKFNPPDVSLSDNPAYNGIKRKMVEKGMMV